MLRAPREQVECGFVACGLAGVDPCNGGGRAGPCAERVFERRGGADGG